MATFSDGVVSDDVLSSDNFVLECFNNGVTVTLQADYVVLDKGIIDETVRTADGTLVTEITYHRVSEEP